MRNPNSSSEKPVIDPRWNEYLDTSGLDTSGLGARPTAAPVEESAHNRVLRELMAEIISPWQFGEASSRETLIRLKRLADLQL
ncbi:hypothetical protein [Knoellia sp. p5-6-4]|uniref:hypothetical protein n=1 Tax=unclassified Knoellia TaxID=2618719 RepID=UPI0023DB6D1B|nr:hypothetical protein [Knoellia sp. p5-6-4]MDF2144136.1 hypothetical protein [Knoellia sp. p5-6-4]